MNKFIIMSLSLSILIGCASSSKNLHSITSKLVQTPNNKLLVQSLVEEFKEQLKKQKPLKLENSLESRKIYSAKGSISTKGVPFLFVGSKSTEYQGDFRQKLLSHVKLVKRNTANSKVLQSYYIFASDTYEVALMIWGSEKEMSDFFLTLQGKEILEDSSKFLDSIVWKSIKLD